ncbi:PP2C family protein-serine/threonine phosphatase [Antribacter gilvus]|uniref:PP2C family protein-serine/threonine phosphatase n=1 Tax=Antribacter gilvus TaxID=2304675 RepID=UPI0013E0BA64|nr:PP2C family protein-serine/threonine phosphatase [Antribacter gilvus]
MAARAALALDNARLYRQQRHLAEGFQRSLLTPPLPTDQFEIAVRYQPAAQAAEVGGDWYDVFHQPGGGTVAVIGDVSGHDVVAAATMSHIRTALRSIAVTTGAGPAELLQQVDRAQHTLESDALATVVVARLEQADDGSDVRLRWSNAGHLPPMIVGQDRSVTPLSAGQPDVLIGVSPDTDRTEEVTVLERGATVVLYTDGLIERRGEHLRDGIGRLEATLADLALLGPDDLCDEVLRRMLPDLPGDDVALVAIRLRP